MFKVLPTKSVFAFVVMMMATFATVSAQTVLINESFTSMTLPAGVTSNGAIQPTKAADGVCTIGMIQVNSGQFIQVDVPSSGVFTMNMKSTSSSTRLVTVKYKKEGEAAYTTVSTTLAVSTAAHFNLTMLFPVLVSAVPISVRLEPTNGNIQVHDLYVEASTLQSTSAEITAFKIPNQIGNEIINSAAGTVGINVPIGTPLTSVVPQTVSLSPQATINPLPSTAQNFTSPVNYTVTAQNGSTKNWTVTVTEIQSTVVPKYKLTVTTNGVGQVTLNPPGGEYDENTVVTLTANSLLNSTFTDWSGDLTGTTNPATITMTSAKNVTATFTSSYNLNFENVIGFASAPGDGFAGPTRGGQCASDTVVINGPSEFNKLAETLYNRQQAYRNNTTVGGIKKAPLVILLKAGIYDGTQTLSTNGAKAYANFMLDIAEQGDLSFVGQSGVVFKIGINVKRSYNLLIRNISFQDYYDDGINIGGEETHHVWVDHCTFGHPTTMPVDTEHPDGGCDVKDGASYVTISWCVFRNSWKTSLAGHSDNNGATDVGRLKTTYANNYFLGTNSRNPRVRFGEVHVLNNLSENVGLYGIAAANGAWVYAENNFYLNTDWAMYADRSVADFKAVFGNNSDGVYTSKTGNYPANGLKQVGNAYDDSGLPVITAQINPAMLNPGGRSVKFDELNAAAVFNPSSYYQYTPLTAQEVRTIIPIYAGADKVQFATSCSNVLPLQLLSFNVSLKDNVANVAWKTTNEINTKTFEIERSNAASFKKIGTVEAKNASGTNNYSFADVHVPQGVSHYRLKQVDADGKATHSNVVTINNTKKLNVSVYPNPAKNVVVISHPRLSASGRIIIVDADGRTVLTINGEAGATNTSADLWKLAAGNYLLTILNEGEKITTRLLKL